MRKLSYLEKIAVCVWTILLAIVLVVGLSGCATEDTNEHAAPPPAEVAPKPSVESELTERIDNLIADLHSSDESKRQIASDELQTIGAEAIPALQTLVNDDRSQLRSARLEALNVLSGFGQDGVPVLAEALKYDDLRARAMTILERMRADAVAALPALAHIATHDPQNQRRFDAIGAMWTIDATAPETIQASSITLQSEALDLRWAVVRHLRTAPAGVFLQAVALFDDPSETVARAADEFLSELMRSNRNWPDLATAAGALLDADATYTRLLAVRLLSRIGTAATDQAESVAALVKDDQNPDALRWAAFYCLHNIGAEQLADQLAENLLESLVSGANQVIDSTQSNTEERVYALTFLPVQGEAVPDTYRRVVLDDRPAEERIAAMQGLQYLQDETYNTVLILGRVIDSRDPSVVSGAKAWVNSFSDQGLRATIELLNSPITEERETAIAILGALDRERLPSVTEPLQSMLASSAQDTRQRAIHAIDSAAMDAQTWIPYLLNMVMDPTENTREMRYQAALALERTWLAADTMQSLPAWAWVEADEKWEQDSIATFIEQAQAVAGDWPMWRYDPGRRGVSPMELPRDLELLWTRQLSPPRRAWPPQQDDFHKLEFDVSYSPIIMDGIVFIGSMNSDAVYAFDASTGKEIWRYYTNGPVRLAPAAWENRVYAVSDDGYLYCIDAHTGTLLWKFFGAPAQHKALGNERIISLWPARGAPVIQDGIVYFASSIWPMHGTFVYALDATSGEVLWANTGTGSIYTLHQHGGADAFGGVAPQGYLALTGNTLLLPGGRTVPGAYDRRTGEMLYFAMGTVNVGKGAGGYQVYAQDNWFLNHGELYHADDGAQYGQLAGLGLGAILHEQALIGLDGQNIVAYNPRPEIKETEVVDRLERRAIATQYDFSTTWQFNTANLELSAPLTRLHGQVGDALLASGQDGLVAIISLENGEPQDVLWQTKIEGEVWEVIAGANQLFVVTTKGRIFAYGENPISEPMHYVYDSEPWERNQDVWVEKAATILSTANVERGYAYLFGVGSGRLLEELIAQSDLHWVAFDPDTTVVANLRQKYDDLGLYGDRVAIHAGNALDSGLPPYIASLIVSEDLAAAGANAPDFVETVFHYLRPYGGTVWLPDQTLLSSLQTANLAQAQVLAVGDAMTITRQGSLPGSDVWTHQYSDSANTTYTDEDLVKPPFGILWWGGTSNEKTLPRHNNGPIPHVVAGRLVILGLDHISVRDVYNGQELWAREFPLVGAPYTDMASERRYQQAVARGEMPSIYYANRPGANYIGSNYASTADGVYMIYDNYCFYMDLETGEDLGRYTLPSREPEEERARWGHISVWQDLLVATADPHLFDNRPIGDPGNWNATSSERLAVLDRFSGELLWEFEAEYGIRHNAIVSSEGKVFVIDSLSTEALALQERRGIEWDGVPRILCFDIYTGEKLWSYSEDVFGTWLSYSQEHDILIQSGRRGAREPLPDEPRHRMIALQGATGDVLWVRNQTYSGPIALAGDMIITGRNEPGIDLLTGTNALRSHLLLGPEKTIPWSYTRTYGCGTQNVSRHIITFRSGAAGFTDLAYGSGTGNLSGFRSGCTNNLIAADGVLNAPEYTRSCSCSYQQQTSLALIHMPEMEMWTYSNLPRVRRESIEQVGINFGAPGDRLAANGVLWLDYPSVGGPSPDVPVSMSSAAEWIRKYSLFIDDGGTGFNYVGSSAVVDPGAIQIALGATYDPLDYNVRLFFTELAGLAPGERVFHVYIEGQRVLEALDVANEADGSDKLIIRDLGSFTVERNLSVELVALDGSQPPILSGIEIVLAD